MPTKPYLRVIGYALLLLPLAVVWYYFPKLKTLFTHPSHFLEVLMNASGLAAFSVQFVLVNVALFLLAALVDLIALGWNHSAVRRLFHLNSASARGDMWCWVLSVLNLYDLVVLLVSFGIFYLLTGLLQKAGGFHLIELVPGTVLPFVIIFILGDLKQYLWHRFMHLGPMWELHHYHHSATEFNLITSARGHFLEKGILTLFDGILFGLLGAPPAFFISFILLKEFYNYLLHSNVGWTLGWVGRYLLVSPRAHTLHHSNEAKHFNKNFGTFFVFWDRLFGTYAETRQAITLGVKDSYYNHKGFWMDMFEGTRRFLRACVGKHD